MHHMLSERGFDLIVYNNYKFRKARLITTGQKWRCTVNSCSVSLLTDISGQHLLKPPQKEHVHQTTKISLDQHLQMTNQTKLTKRDSTHFVIPKNSRKDENNMKIQTIGSDSTLLINDLVNNIIVFGSLQNLLHLYSLDNLLMDGTFPFYTRYSSHILTINGVINGYYVPLIVCLLPGKEKHVYNLLFRHLINKAEELGEIFYPLELIVDFEKSIHLAINETWIGVNITGSRFHLGQAWCRKIAELGFSTIYKDQNSDSGSYLRWCFGLSLLHPSEVEDAFLENLISNATIKIIPFCDYLLQHFIDRNASFPPNMWELDSAESDGVTEACKLFNWKVSSLVNFDCPNILIFLEKIKSIQIEILETIQNDFQTETSFCNTFYSNKQPYLQMKLLSYKEKKVNRFTFVKNVSIYFTN